MSTVTASSSSCSSSMAPSRSATANLTINNKMEFVSAGESGPPTRMFHPSNAPQTSHHSQQQQQQQQQQQPQSPYRFGAPDSRASYSERRVGINSGRSMTAHNHPSATGSSSAAAGLPWHPTNNHQAGAESQGPKPGRSFSSGMASLSRSNGSLAGTANNSIHPAANNETDANGNSKPRSRTQTPGNFGCALSAATGGSATTSAAAHVLASPASSNGSGGGKQRTRGDFGGSHGSLDALASGPERESFFALLRDLGAQSSSGSSNGNGSLVPSRSSPERDLDDPVHAKPVGCAPSRLAELLKPNFHSARTAVSNTQSEPAAAVVPLAGSYSLAVQQQQSVMLRRSTPEPPLGAGMQPPVARSATLPADASSPKPRSKFQRFWDRDRSNKEHKASSIPATTVAIASSIVAVQHGTATSSSATSRSASEPSIFKRLRGGGSASSGSGSSSSSNSKALNGISASPEPDLAATLERDASDMEARLDERLKRKAFAHHDCQSMSVNLGYAARLRGLLAQRRNTTTGASAASMASASSSSSSSSSSTSSSTATSSSLNAATAGSSGSLSGSGKGKLKTQMSYPPAMDDPTAGPPLPAPADEVDTGDGKSNQLLQSCPFFRNELGGEPEWCVGVSRCSSPQLQQPQQQHPSPTLLHRPVSTYGVSVLEFPPGKSHWRHGICPYQKQPSVLERGDQGAFYYGNHFYAQEHQNWFGMDENLGPIAISIRREKMSPSDVESNNSHHHNHHHHSHHSHQKDQYIYRIIIRTSELATLRGTVLEEAIPSLKPPGPKGLSLREVLDMVSPEIHLPCLRLAIPGPTTEQQLLKLDQQGLSNHYKVGILYCKAGQSTEEEMYNNEEGGQAFDDFLNLIGQRVRLRGFEKYKAGLDNKMDSTGLYSLYSQYQDRELMFHVSSLLPFTPNNRQQLLRKRHIGNDIVTIVFQEPGALPFSPKNIRSQFQHVFIIVRVLHPCTDHTQYQVAVSRSKEVPIFGPPIPTGATFPKSQAFVDFLLAKIINAEHAAHRSQKFATMATRTRQEYLKDLATNYVTGNTLDSGSKFPILTFSSRKKERLKPKFFPDAVQSGAICWQVSVDDFSGGGGSVRQTDSLLGISSDSLVLVEESTKECIWAVSCKAILGWTSSTSSIKLYYHQGECITVQGRDCEADEIPEIVARLHAVTSGCGTRELSLRRNAVGQLGFHVQPDGLVTEVEPHGPAWQASLRQGFRLVEICKVTVATLNHEQMVDLLKTSAVVTVTVLPPVDPNTPRQGCTLQSCSYIVGSIDGEYDNVGVSGEGVDNGSATVRSSGAVQQQSVSIHSRRLRYERSVSPPRSSSSSGYGTGSSSRSFTVQGAAALAASAAAAAGTATMSAVIPTNAAEGTLKSTSSGHSSDDPWYDFMPEVLEAELLNGPGGSTISPPPLPSRQGPPPSRLRSGHSCDNFTPTAISVHQPSTPAVENVKSSRSQDQIFPHDGSSPVKNRPAGPVYSTPPSKVKPILESPSLVGRMSNYEDLRRLQQTTANTSAVPQETSGGSKVRPLNPPDYHHAMQSRLVALKSPDQQHGPNNRKSPSSTYTSRSEDELSAGSANSLSPRSRRKHSKNNGAGNLTPSSGSSRNQSPRMFVEAKLKSNANGSVCSGGSGGNGQKRSSTNLQEDLLRLISPDAVDEVSADDSSVIVTHARPANAVLSSANSSVQSADMADLPDSEEMDWSRLVHAAARAIQGAATTMASAQEDVDDDLMDDEVEEPTRDGSDNQDSLTSWIDDVTEKLRLEAEAAESPPGGIGSTLVMDDVVQLRMSQLEQHVGSLENRLRGEEDRRQALEAEIRRLREANSRLAGESQTAAQQLKRFTDWFFQTIERP
ncbi:signal-induced proliferation-associated 1-like protein 1 [Daphnia carinata]|uniref:signal-induced proliferation-associated 1-like protein 1 n=1 Tax=Daphnia carinata TaxID=120202 RepID=UPI00257A2756|nr:signal-induced proliferation-associated 1-like protein 1 [Daphnia carinata]XP_057379209.1 signal-induced proliferation-associated 1-like protein 1 [Daphnia carinata]